MYKKVTMKNIAEKLGISKGLVSIAIADKYGVSEEMRSKIMLTATEMGYIFKEKVKKTNHIICILFSSECLLREGFWQSIIISTENRLREIGLKTEYFVYEKNQLNLDKIRSTMKEVAGFITLANHNEKLVHLFHENNINVIYIDSLIETDVDTIEIRANNRLTGFKTAEFLIENGHKNISFFGNTRYSQSFKERYEGMLNCISKYNDINFYDISLKSDNSESLFNLHFATMLIVEKKITAVICANDSIAYTIYDICRKNNIKIPQDLSIIGIDDMNESKYINPPLTTMKIKRKEIGKKSAEIMSSLLSNSFDGIDKIEYSSELIVRDSISKLK